MTPIVRNYVYLHVHTKRYTFVPVDREGGRGFISLSTIFWCRALRLKGSTVKGRVPVNMAYMFTPLEDTHKRTSLLANFITRMILTTFSMCCLKIHLLARYPYAN